MEMENREMDNNEKAARYRNMMNVLNDIAQERRAQILRYGYNDDLYDGTGSDSRWLAPLNFGSAKEIETQFRADYLRFERATGKPTWMHLLREEFAEALSEDDPEKLQVELVQVAALCVSFVEQIRRRGLNPAPGE